MLKKIRISTDAAQITTQTNEHIVVSSLPKSLLVSCTVSLIYLKYESATSFKQLCANYSLIVQYQH